MRRLECSTETESCLTVASRSSLVTLGVLTMMRWPSGTAVRFSFAALIAEMIGFVCYTVSEAAGPASDTEAS